MKWGAHVRRTIEGPGHPSGGVASSRGPRFVASLVAGLAFAGCAQPAPVATGPPVSLDVSTGMPDAEYAIEPATLRVPLGSEVTLHVRDDGIYPHNFVIAAFHVETRNLVHGENVTVRFVADRAGSFETRCAIPGHYQEGMKGTLIVG